MPVDFEKKFLPSYLANSFGSLTKKEIDILVFTLLYDDGYFGTKPSYHDISLKLKIPQTKVRTLIHEMHLRQTNDNKEGLNEELINILANRAVLRTNSRVEIGIEKQIILEHLDFKVKDLGSHLDYKNNREVAVIDEDTFTLLLMDLMSDRQRTLVENGIKDVLEKQEITLKEQLPTFWESFKCKAGEKAGEQSVDLLNRLVNALITGGASEIKGILETIMAGEDASTN